MRVEKTNENVKFGQDPYYVVESIISYHGTNTKQGRLCKWPRAYYEVYCNLLHTYMYIVYMYMAYMAMFLNVIRGGNFHIVGDLNRVGSLEDISDK